MVAVTYNLQVQQPTLIPAGALIERDVELVTISYLSEFGNPVVLTFVGTELDDPVFGEVTSFTATIDTGNGPEVITLINGLDAPVSLISDAAIFGGAPGDGSLFAFEDYVFELDDDITGSAFDDEIWGYYGSDTIDGGAGADVLVGDVPTDPLDGEADSLFGGAGNDTLEGGAGGDTLDGGADFDFAAYVTSPAGVDVDLRDAVQTGAAPGGVEVGDELVSIEGLWGSELGDTLTGDAGQNLLAGLGGADSLVGVGGQNTLLGGAGNDSLFGGDDIDFLEGGLDADDLDGGDNLDLASYSNALTGVVANLSNPLENTGEAAGDTYANIEGILGSAQDDTLTGTGNDDALFGGDGADEINGGEGGDLLLGSGIDISIGAGLPDLSFDPIDPLDEFFGF